MGFKVFPPEPEEEKMDLLGIGHCVVDHLTLLKKYPHCDSKNEALGSWICGGGPVLNACVTASRLGLAAAFVGAAGKDEAAACIQQTLKEAGVDSTCMRLGEGDRTARASIWIEAERGQRTVALDRGKLADLQTSDLDPLDFSNYRMLLLDGKEPVGLEAASRARARGAKVMLDLGGQRENPAELIGLCDYLIVSKSFIMSQYPEAELFEVCNLLAGMGPELVVVTLGAGGSMVKHDGQPFWFPAYDKVKVVDTTGAGDAFHGALAWALLNGLDTRTALAAAAIAGACCCQEPGGHRGVPTREELMIKVADWQY
jgi:sulfofructose kinase